MSRKFNTDGASDYLLEKWGIPRKPSTMRKLRLTGGGPIFFRLSGNQVLYAAEDLDAWAEKALTKHASTAGYARSAPCGPRQPNRNAGRLGATRRRSSDFRDYVDCHAMLAALHRPRKPPEFCDGDAACERVTHIRKTLPHSRALAHGQRSVWPARYCLPTARSPATRGARASVASQRIVRPRWPRKGWPSAGGGDDEEEDSSPDDTVTKTARGRPPRQGVAPMSAAERQRRRRAKSEGSARPRLPRQKQRRCRQGPRRRSAKQRDCVPRRSMHQPQWPATSRRRGALPLNGPAALWSRPRRPVGGRGWRRPRKRPACVCGPRARRCSRPGCCRAASAAIRRPRSNAMSRPTARMVLRDPPDLMGPNWPQRWQDTRDQLDLRERDLDRLDAAHQAKLATLHRLLRRGDVRAALDMLEAELGVPWGRA